MQLTKHGISACQSNTTKLFGLDVCGSGSGASSGPEGIGRVIDCTKIPDAFISKSVIENTPQMVTQRHVFRINWDTIPDSMVTRNLSEASEFGGASLLSDITPSQRTTSLGVSSSERVPECVGPSHARIFSFVWRATLSETTPPLETNN